MRIMSNEQIGQNRRAFLSYFSSIGLSSTLLPGALWAQVQDPHTPRITIDMLKAAEHIAGLEFTDAERELLIDDVNDNLARCERMRAIPLQNSVPSCLRFSPVMPGMKFDTVRRPMKTSKWPEAKRPANLEDVAFWPVTQLATLIRTRQVRSVELTEMYLSRLKRYDPKLKFVISLTDDLAMTQARQADSE